MNGPLLQTQTFRSDESYSDGSTYVILELPGSRSSAFRSAPQTAMRYATDDTGVSKGWSLPAAQEYCTNLYELMKMRKIPNYAVTAHIGEQCTLDRKMWSRHSHIRCIEAQKPLWSFCERELCPMDVFKDDFFYRIPSKVPREAYEEADNAPRYSAIQRGKFMVSRKVRRAFSKLQALAGIQETRSYKHERMVQAKIDRYYEVMNAPERKVHPVHRVKCYLLRYREKLREEWAREEAEQADSDSE